jgi:hypothetical protein
MVAVVGEDHAEVHSDFELRKFLGRFGLLRIRALRIDGYDGDE